MNRSETQRELPDDVLERRDDNSDFSGRDARPEKRPDESALEGSPCNLVVDIYDQMYHLRGPDPKYLEQLSALVDAKMRAVAQHGTTVDSLRVAVLAALNIADELVTLQQQRDALTGNVALNIKSRTETLAEMLDAVLESNRKAG
ncbi:MAG: cell division protein ZapA [Acidobacteriaceae bacterium]